MKKRIMGVLLAVGMVFTLLPTAAWAAEAPFENNGGNGTEGDPYQIATLEQLEAFRDYINSDPDGGSGEYFKLTADIDMSDKYGGGTSWTPIGTRSIGFNGEFDGAGHTVKVSLLYTDSTIDYVGLFGTVGSYISSGRGAISNLGVSGSISSTAAVIAIGGIMGQNGNGMIESCYSSVNITGSGSIGGIAGMNVSGSISNCYNTGDITNSSTDGSDGTGGIAGENYTGIMSCYNTGKITLAKGGAASVGGIAGTNGIGLIMMNCYYLTGTAEKGISDTDDAAETVEKKTAEEFKTLAADLNDGWNVWYDSSFLGRPVFTAFPEGGSGTAEDPYLIPNLATLEAVRDYINSDPDGGSGEYFKLTDDIIMSEEYGAEKGEGGTSWTPIGKSDTKEFQGTFDGGGYTISGLYINTTQKYAGLFGYSSGTVKNLTVSGSVTGKSYVGGIVGRNDGSIKNCYNTGEVSGTEDSIGGIAGYNHIQIENCYNMGTVSGDYRVGGIAGYSEGSVNNCYNKGDVKGVSDIGGIVGDNHGSIKNCYYLANSCTTPGGGISKTAEEFKSGEVAWLLQNGQDAQVWGQKLGDGADEYPVLTTDTSKKVLKVTFATSTKSDYAVEYANYNGTVELPAEPTLDGMAFDHWSTVNSTSGGSKFDNTTAVTEDMTVYAVGRNTFGGESNEIAFTTTYGTALTEDLARYVHYESAPEAPVTGKFTYTITGGNETLGAETVGDNLIIPANANAGDYLLTIQATEIEPQYSLMSVGSYGTADVTLTVKVSIAKAESSVTVEPMAKTDLKYNGDALELVTVGEATGGEMQYSLDGNSYSADIPMGTEAKEYTVWYKVVGDENHEDTAPAKIDVTIGKAQAAVTVPPAARDLTYSGEEQALVTAGESNFGMLVYSLDDPDGPFTAAIPTAAEAGLYTVYYQVEEAGNWNASVVGSVQVEIHQADSSATVRRRTGLVYSGEAQELVTADEVTGGELVYALGENAETFPASGYEGHTPTAVDAGTYYVWWKIVGDADHGDTEPACITVTIAPFPLTLEPVEVETPYTGAAISVAVAQASGQIPTIDLEKITVSYEQDGAAAEPVLPGTYDVLASLTDPNFTLTGTAKVGSLTISHVHVYAEEWTHDTEDHWHVCQGVGACDASRSDLAAHVWDDGVVTLEPTTEAEGSRLYTCSVCGAARSEPISKVNTFQISGVVTDHDGSPLSPAAIRLTRGQETVAETVTDDQGRYSFSSVPSGLYNVAATWDTVIKTILVELSDADAHERNIQMPEGKVSSVVEVLGEDTPDVVVGGVDAIAEAETASPAETVTVTLTVEKKDTPADKAALEAAASTQAANLTYLDMTLTKTTTGAGSSEVTITDASAVLEIVIPFDFTNKTNVTAYRSHNNTAEALTKADADARIDGTFRLDEAGGKIYIYASKFSTYAIGYTPTPPAPPTYTATVTQPEHGALEVSPAWAIAGSRVTVTVTPDAGYELGALTITDRSGNAVEYKDNGGGTFTFVMPSGGVTVEAAFAPACMRDETCPLAKFTDAAPTAWYHDGVHYCVEYGLMAGISATTFAPDMPTSRAMIVTILWREAGSPVVNYLMQYDDVEPEAWYTEAVRWATSEGVVDGYGNGLFGPNDPITREQLAAMLWRYANAKGWSVSVGEGADILSFEDFDQICEWAVPAIRWAAGNGIVQGKGGLLDPRGQATRAQAAAMLQRFLTSKIVPENT